MNVFQNNYIFSKILNYIDSIKLISLLTINKRWNQRIRSKFHEQALQSLVFSRIWVAHDNISNKYPLLTFNKNEIVTIVKESYHMKTGILMKLVSKETGELYLRVKGRNRYVTYIDLGIKLCECVKSLSIKSDRFHLNHMGHYVSHIQNEISIISILLKIDHLFSLICEVHRNNFVKSDWQWNNHFQICNSCLGQFPIRFNTKFLDKLAKYNPRREHCRRWHQNNMVFYIDGTDIKIFCQMTESDQVVFKKFVFPDRFENHKNCRLSESYFFKNGFFILEHRCENKSIIRVVNLKTNNSSIVKRDHMIPYFSSIFWSKKMNDYIIVDEKWFDHLESFFSISFLMRQCVKDFNLKAKYYHVMTKFCKKTNNVVILHLNGVFVININKIFKY